MINNELAIHIANIRVLSPSQEWFAMNPNGVLLGASRGFMYSLSEANIIGQDYLNMTDYAKEFFSGYLLVLDRIKKSKNNKFKFIRAKLIKEHILLGDLRISKINSTDTNELLGVMNFLNLIQFSPSIISLFSCTKFSGFIEVVTSDMYTNATYENFVVTELPHIICWLLVLNKTHQEIASILSIIYQKNYSLNNISYFIKHYISDKFDVSINKEVLAKIYQTNILHSIPDKLFEYLNSDHV